jgi:hypothetical protein
MPMEETTGIPTATEIEGNLQETGGKKRKLRLRKGAQAVANANNPALASGGLPNRPAPGLAPIQLPGEGTQGAPWMGMPSMGSTVA